MNLIESYQTAGPDGSQATCSRLQINDVLDAFEFVGVATVGQAYTFSCWAKADEAGAVTAGGKTFAISADWAQHIVTFTADSPDFALAFGSTGTYYIYHAQLERGNMATDWTPAPEDIQEAVNERPTEAAMNAAISMAVKDSEASVLLQVGAQYDDKEQADAKLQLLVKQLEDGKLVSILNASAQEIRLSGDRLIIDSTYFKLAKDGSMRATSAAQVFLEPGVEEMLTIKNHILKISLIDDSELDLYDFNSDGIVSVTDFLIAKSVVLGKATLADWDKAVKSNVSISINPADLDRAILVSGTNMWGRTVERHIGINGTNIDNVIGSLAIGGSLAVGDLLLDSDGLAIGAGAPKALSWKDNGDGTFTLIGQ